MSDHARPGIVNRWRLGAVVVAVLSILLTAVGTAAAAPNFAASHPDFTAQASRAGLTNAQAQELQARVDKYLAKAGGVQIAANEIALPGGGRVLLALPGEKTARNIDGTTESGIESAATGDATAGSAGITSPAGVRVCWPTSLTCCAYLYICGWSHTNGFGDVVTAFNCNVDVEVPDSFTGNGSWLNNQTPGTVASFKAQNRSVIFRTRGAESEGNPYNWHPVWFIQAC
jgi:hypothetical protein